MQRHRTAVQQRKAQLGMPYGKASKLRSMVYGSVETPRWAYLLILAEHRRFAHECGVAVSGMADRGLVITLVCYLLIQEPPVADFVVVHTSFCGCKHATAVAR